MGTRGSMVLLSWRLSGGIPALDALPTSSSSRWGKATSTPGGNGGVVCPLLVDHDPRVFFHLNGQTRHLPPPSLPGRSAARGMALVPLVATGSRRWVGLGDTSSHAYTGANSLGIGCR